MESKDLFTSEARRLLERESERIASELEEEAFNEALRSRGEPVEVTASDVRKAASRFVKRDVPLRPYTDLLLKVYLATGILLFFGGLLYPYIKSLLENSRSDTRISVLVAISGVVLSLFSFFFRYYMEALIRTKSRRRLEEYEEQKLELKSSLNRKIE